MSDVRLIPGAAEHAGATPGRPEATQALATLLRYAWQKARTHLRHSFTWIVLCGYLAYSLWLKDRPSQPPVPLVGSGGESSGVHTVRRPSLEPATLLGHWQWMGTPRTELEFLPDGAVISRTQKKADRGTYHVQGDKISLRFDKTAIFWDGTIFPLPDRFILNDNRLTLIVTLRQGDIPEVKMYQFQRIDAPPSVASESAAATQ